MPEPLTDLIRRLVGPKTVNFGRKSGFVQLWRNQHNTNFLVVLLPVQAAMQNKTGPLLDGKPLWN